MKLSTRKKNFNFTYIIIAITCLLLGGLVGIYILGKTSQQNTTNSEKNSQTTKIDDQNSAKGSSNSATPETTNSVPTNSALSAKITTLEQDGNSIKFKGIVTGAKSSGTCVITFENPNDKPVIRSLDSTEKDGSQICGEVSIPSLEFSYLGSWNVTFRFIVNGSQTAINDKIDIR